MTPLLIAVVATVIISTAILSVSSATAEAKSCTQLRALCWTMRDDNSDCARPYQRCLKTGVFVTPLGRRLPATSRR